MHKKYGELIISLLAKDQSHYVEQKEDGTYWKKAGVVNSKLIEQVFLEQKSIANIKKQLMSFAKNLSSVRSHFLLEYSGSRGFHVWITFDEAVNYRTGYDRQQAILQDVDFDSNLIDIDLFSHSATPTILVFLH